jgi:hypothetical protein
MSSSGRRIGAIFSGDSWNGVRSPNPSRSRVEVTGSLTFPPIVDRMLTAAMA